ncbi:gibberellin 2-beta-dioxygenase 2-like [Aristolochia californica]|uniref:gibberellin 2-beta-dioxygenase 2-like n=1 Tax=Aristolochia californica TaxID=171875 RepID=UPI0035E38484
MSLPVIDLARKRTQVAELMVKACEDYGFFKVINHGVPQEVITRMEAEGQNFFSRPASAKQRAGPANPMGYGCRNIGFNGDTGEVEYLLLHTNPISIAQRSKAISRHPSQFCSVVTEYIEAVRELACEMLELLAEGMRIPDKKVLSRLIRDDESDSVFRMNHYPCCKERDASHRVGFGEHSDPQILTLLRSNGVGGLQISLEDGVWVPVPPDPNSFCVNVGDALQAISNGRFVSVRHRAMANSFKSRMSMIYFGAPSLHAQISPLPELVSPQNPSLYRPFTWTEYKKAAYSLRLSDSRLDLFRTAAHGQAL